MDVSNVVEKTGAFCSAFASFNVVFCLNWPRDPTLATDSLLSLVVACRAHRQAGGQLRELGIHSFHCSHPTVVSRLLIRFGSGSADATDQVRSDRQHPPRGQVRERPIQVRTIPPDAANRAACFVDRSPRLRLVCRVHIYHKATDTWYDMQDLHVWTTETMPQLVRRTLSRFSHSNCAFSLGACVLLWWCAGRAVGSVHSDLRVETVVVCGGCWFAKGLSIHLSLCTTQSLPQ